MSIKSSLTGSLGRYSSARVAKRSGTDHSLLPGISSTHHQKTLSSQSPAAAIGLRVTLGHLESPTGPVAATKSPPVRQ